MVALRTLVASLVSLSAVAAAALDAAPANDYPTVARADYVFACMAANGNTRTALEQCACSIDHIATVLPYAAYVSAETVLRMRQLGGERTGVFLSAASAKASVSDLRRAQAEADVLCF